MGRKPAIAISLVNLAELDRIEGKLAKAVERHAEAHRLRHESGDLPGVAISHLKLGVLETSGTQTGLAAKYVRDSLDRFHALGYRDWMARAFEAMSELATVGEQPDAAAILRGAAAALDDTLGTKKSPLETARDTDLTDQLKASLPDGSFREAWRTGGSLTLETAYQYATDLRLDTTREPEHLLCD